MSRILFTFLLAAIVIPSVSLRADEPAQQGGTVVEAGTLVLTDSNALSAGTTISGTASTVPGVGHATMTKTGTNTYRGTTTINGNVSLGIAGDPQGSYSGSTTISGGTLHLGNGAPNVIHAGQGLLVLTGSNTYTGGTVINGYTQQPINGGITGPTLNPVGQGTLTLASSTNINGGVPPAGTFYFTPANPNNINTYSGGAINNAVPPTNGGAVQFQLGNPNPNGAGVSLTKSGSGTLTLSGFNTYTGVTVMDGSKTFGGVINAVPPNGSSNTLVGTATINGGGLQTGNADWTSATNSGALVYDLTFPTNPNLTLGVIGNSAFTATPIPAGPVFYIITEGAGIGDSVRSVPCTGKETVLDAIGHVNGIPQVSSTKIWIARPSPSSREQSTILKVDWEAISRNGINATNYTLMPGDRLVLGEDPLITRSNLIGKKTAIVERLDGVIGLTSNTLSGLSSLSAADRAVMKDLVRKGVFTDDEELKHLLLDAMQFGEQVNKKPGAKSAAEQKTGKGEGKKSTFAAAPKAPAGTMAAAAQKGDKAEEKSNTVAGLLFLSGANTYREPTTISGGTLTVGPAVVRLANVTVSPGAPHELAMQPLPDYRIEPPDVISIEMLKLIPLPPYRAAIFDVLQIRANALPDQPIDNYFIVEADGKVALGPTFGSVHVAGMTIEEITATLNKSLRQWLRDPNAYVQLARVEGRQPVSGQYLVGPDGTINLRKYGRVSISGKTIAEARSAIENQLAAYLQAPEVSVDVVAYNSKTFYIVTQGAGIGDNVRRLPITGKETVLDAIAQINGLSQVSSKNISIVRPNTSDPGKPTILHVDWDGITGRGATATNYQLFPGDRIFIREDPLVTRTNLLGKKTAILERLNGIVSLTTNTISGLDNAPGADAVLKDLVRKGVFTDDEELKGILQEVIRLREVEQKKAPPKEAEKRKLGQ